MKKAIFIPARRGSTRLKDKLLLPVKDKPVIAWTVENALKVGYPVVVVCDDLEFKNVLKDYPVEVILTPSDLKSGSDRIAFALKDLDYDTVVNLQGDEPTVDPQDIKKYSKPLKKTKLQPYPTL